MRVGISCVETDPRAAADEVLAAAPDGGRRPCGEVSTRTPYVVPAVGEKRFTVAALDLGIKTMTPIRMAEHGIEVAVLPSLVDRDDVLAHRPGRRVLLQRPGRSGDRRRPVAPRCEASSTRGIPFFGICFGNQLLGRALGLLDVQAALRSSRHQPAGAGPDHRQGRGHRAQPRLRGGRPGRAASTGPTGRCGSLTST